MPTKIDDPFFLDSQAQSPKSTARTVHGFTKHGKIHPLYQCWNGIKRRCLDPRRKDYRYYGGRGIRVCPRWMIFENFKNDMYPLWQPGLTIERRDNNGDYCPENCYWATRMQQAQNTSQAVLVEIDGETRTVSDWIRIRGMKRYTVMARIMDGWHPYDALTKPIRKWVRK